MDWNDFLALFRISTPCGSLDQPKIVSYHLSDAGQAKLLELLRKIERNTKGFDPQCNHGINHTYAVEAIALVLNLTPATIARTPPRT